MKAKVKKTGEIVEVKDYGPKFIPRYFDNTTGYFNEELEFIQ